MQMDYDYLRIELQETLEEAGLDRVQAVVKVEKFVSELQREDRLMKQMDKDFRNVGATGKVFDRIFSKIK